MRFNTYDAYEPEYYSDEPEVERPIDQIYCDGCGRPMVIWADVDLKESDLTCGRCKKGLAPEWEY